MMFIFIFGLGVFIFNYIRVKVDCDTCVLRSMNRVSAHAVVNTMLIIKNCELNGTLVYFKNGYFFFILVNLLVNVFTLIKSDCAVFKNCDHFDLI